MTTMQKVIKYLAIALAVGLIVAIVGGVCSVLAAITGIASWNHRDQSGESAGTSFSGTISSEVTMLQMEVGAARIWIKTGDELYVEANNPYITVADRNGTLYIQEESHIADLDDSSLTIYIPEDMVFDQVDMTTGAGLIDLEQLSCQKLELELGAGKAEFQKLTVTGKADIEGGAGQFILHNGQLHNLDFEMGVGEGDIVTSLTGSADIASGIGALYLTVLGNADDFTVYAESGLGRVEVDNRSISGEAVIGSGPNRLEIEGGIGNITVDFEG